MSCERFLGAVALLLVVGGCAFGQGEPFGQLKATLRAEHQRLETRRIDAHFDRLDSAFEIAIDAMVLVVDEVALEGEHSAASPAANSDPHADHDEQDAAVASAHDGALLMAGSVDLLVGQTLALPCVENEGCVLDEGRLTQAELSASRLVVRGLVRDGQLPARFDGELFFEADIQLDDAGNLEAALDLPIDDDHPSQIALQLSLETSAALFDSVQWQPLGKQQASFDAGPLRERFAALDLNLHIHRSDP